MRVIANTQAISNARHCLKSFASINSFNPQNNSMVQSSSPFLTDEETETQRY